MIPTPPPPWSSRATKATAGWTRCPWSTGSAAPTGQWLTAAVDGASPRLKCLPKTNNHWEWRGVRFTAPNIVLVFFKRKLTANKTGNPAKGGGGQRHNDKLVHAGKKGQLARITRPTRTLTPPTDCSAIARSQHQQSGGPLPHGPWAPYPRPCD